MTSNLAALCAEYRRSQTGLTMKERIQHEDEIWRTHRTEAPQERLSRSTWLKNHFGGSTMDYEYRHAILRAAKHLRYEDKKLTFSDALDIAIKNFNDSGHHASNGKGRLPLPLPDGAPAPSRPPPPPSSPPPASEKSPDKTDTVALIQQVNELSNKYRSQPELTHRQRYELEIEIWALQRKIVPSGAVHLHKETRREYQLQKLLGRPVSDFERHRHIGSLGEAAAELWERVERDMTLTATQSIIYSAKELVKSDDLDLKEAVHRVIAEYDRIAGRKRRQDGKVVKVRNNTETVSQKPQSVNASATASKDRGEDAVEFRGDVRQLTEKFVGERMVSVDIDPYLRDKIIKDFEQWIEAGITDLFYEVRRHSNNARRENLTTKIGRTRFHEACLTLGIQGEFNKHVNMILAKKRWAERSNQLHADRYGNKYTDALREEFQRVQEAYQLLKDYMRQLKR